MKLTRSKLLNHAGFFSTAAIAVKVETTKMWSDKKKDRIEGEVTISDCSRVVTLDFNVDTKEELENALYKADTLAEFFSTLHARLEEVKEKDVIT